MKKTAKRVISPKRRKMIKDFVNLAYSKYGKAFSKLANE